MHSAAHRADWLKFLGGSRHLTPGDQGRVLEAISAKLHDAPVVLTFGEDERIARAILSVVGRGDFDQDRFRTWVERTVARPPARPSLADLRAGKNVKNVFAKLEVLLAVQDTLAEPAVSARGALRRALQKMY